MDHVKEVDVDDWDILYDDLVDLMLNFTYGELVSIRENQHITLFKLQLLIIAQIDMQLDAQDAIYDIWDGDYDYTSNRDIDYDIDEMRTCRGA